MVFGGRCQKLKRPRVGFPIAIEIEFRPKENDEEGLFLETAQYQWPVHGRSSFVCWDTLWNLVLANPVMPKDIPPQPQLVNRLCILQLSLPSLKALAQAFLRHY
jgi:hypothetical protein